VVGCGSSAQLLCARLKPVCARWPLQCAMRAAPRARPLHTSWSTRPRLTRCARVQGCMRGLTPGAAPSCSRQCDGEFGCANTCALASFPKKPFQICRSLQISKFELPLSQFGQVVGMRDLGAA
jgi:hypothetical protein